MEVQGHVRSRRLRSPQQVSSPLSPPVRAGFFLLRSALSNVPRCGTARLTAAPVLHLKSPGLTAARSETRPWTELQKSPRGRGLSLHSPDSVSCKADGSDFPEILSVSFFLTDHGFGAYPRIFP